MNDDTTITQTRVLIVGLALQVLEYLLHLSKQASLIKSLLMRERLELHLDLGLVACPCLPFVFFKFFGLTDLNSIDPDTSPADFLHTQHPKGVGYADYLQAIVSHFKLPVRTGVNILSVQELASGFAVESSDGPIRTDYIVWAAGQFFILVTKISRELNTLFIIQRLKTGQSLKEILLLSLAAMKAVMLL